MLRGRTRERTRRVLAAWRWLGHFFGSCVGVGGVWGIGGTGSAGGFEAPTADLGGSGSAWERSGSARLGFGFKDNVALSQARPEASAYFRSALDVTAVRLPVDGWQGTLLFSGEDHRYFSSSTVDHEDVIFGLGEIRRFWLNDWQAALSFEGAFLDQVVDLSVTETNRARLVVRGGTLVSRPSVRRELSELWWVNLESPLTRQFFDGLPDDYWAWAPRMTLGRTYGTGSELSLNYELGYRHYDTDAARQDDRGVITNRTRVTWQHEVQVLWKQHWDRARRWRSTTRLGYRVSADQRGGYFDHRRTLLGEQVRFRSGAWELSAEARLAWYHFPHQKGSNRRADRERLDALASARVERALGRHWRVFAEYEHAFTDSSLVLEEYSANNVWGGVEVQF